MKRVLKGIGLFIICYVFFFVFAPVLDLSINFPYPYIDPIYWLLILVSESVIFAILFYFYRLNPRTTLIMVSFSIPKIILSSLLFTALFFCLLFGTILFAQIRFFLRLYILLVVLLILFYIYAAFYRGIVIYQNGKIRVFNFKIYTYRNAQINTMTYKKVGKLYLIRVWIGQDIHRFSADKRFFDRLNKRWGRLEPADPNETTKKG